MIDRLLLLVRKLLEYLLTHLAHSVTHSHLTLSPPTTHSLTPSLNSPPSCLTWASA